MKRTAFGGFHPIVQFIFFSVVITLSIFHTQPVLLTISFLAAFFNAVVISRKGALRLLLWLVIPSFLLISIINPLFNHAGVTILFYLPDENPFTLESVLYGIASGAVFSTAALWCFCLGSILTSDRVMYLFGRVSPKLALLISMTLGFIPKLSRRFGQIRAAQRSIGQDVNSGGILHRIKCLAHMIGALVSWSLESSMDTADSIKSRGYGLPKRTSFSVFRFEKRDGIMLVYIVVSTALLSAALLGGEMEYYYFPAVSPVTFSPADITRYITLLLLCIMPIFLQWREDRQWNATGSVI